MVRSMVQAAASRRAGGARRVQSPVSTAAHAYQGGATATAAQILALQRAAGNQAVQRVVAGSLQDLRGKKPSADDLRKTREYKAYMDPALKWQWQFKARPEEALEACRAIFWAIERGEHIDWSTQARYYLLNARKLLTPEVADWTPPKLAAKHHYRVELKAWIPHEHVVDPVPGVTNSQFRGDDNYGTSHRDWKRGPFSGTESDTATGYTGRELNTESYFTMWISSKNPIPLAPAPEINSEVDVFAGCSNISLVYTTDEFPSHGIRVFEDGKVIDTKTVFDASTVDGTDPSEIFLGLTEYNNKGDFDVAVAPDLQACQPTGQVPTTVPP